LRKQIEASTVIETAEVDMRLASWLRRNKDLLVQAWAAHASTLPAGHGLARQQLEDSAADLLVLIADELKANGLRGRRKVVSRQRYDVPSLTAIARNHATNRLAFGFTVDQMASEYRTLRATVMQGWMADLETPDVDLSSLLRFHELIDQAWFESSAWYGERVSNALELFLGALGHDLKTPLGAVIFSGEAIVQSDELRTEATKNLAAGMLFSARRMSRMIDDLLDFTRARLGNGLEVQPVDCNLRLLLQQAVGEVQALHPSASISLDVDPELSGRWDPFRLTQMFANLIVNAAQYGELSKPISVIGRARGAQVIVTVHNHGPVIPPDLIGIVFDPLVRGDHPPGTGIETGLGLGLYISRQIAQAHKGDIAASSSPESGTTFTVQLPAHVELQPPS
jgi:signal transduction histidine kinase